MNNKISTYTENDSAFKAVTNMSTDKEIFYTKDFMDLKTNYEACLPTILKLC